MKGIVLYIIEYIQNYPITVHNEKVLKRRSLKLQPKKREINKQSCPKMCPLRKEGM